ncbi:MAG: hypothetical protein SWH54_17450 [Thermodesulfobacteriota bacterium]|nr:hypothetical protein [Thermodesulfobacteriota bacterium]
MIKFYTNRELSQKLNINLARFKRWSREFLPPDPLGGMQSGYARQYSIDNAFTIYLGGHLVGELKYTIPQANKILEDLKKWLRENDFYINTENPGKTGNKARALVKEYIIFILQENDLATGSGKFSYRIRGIISNLTANNNEYGVREERYIEDYVPADKRNNHIVCEKMLKITMLHRYFKTCVTQVDRLKTEDC